MSEFISLQSWTNTIWYSTFLMGTGRVYHQLVHSTAVTVHLRRMIKSFHPRRVMHSKIKFHLYSFLLMICLFCIHFFYNQDGQNRENQYRNTWQNSNKTSKEKEVNWNKGKSKVYNGKSQPTLCYKWPKNWKSEPGVETYLNGKRIPRGFHWWVEISYISMSWVFMCICVIFLIRL